MALTVDNFGSGLLVDEELMAGVTEESGSFVAFVLRHTTGEYLGYRPYPRLEDALSAINAIPRPWQFEASGGCGTGNC